MSDPYNQPGSLMSSAAHDRTRDRDVIEAAFLIERIANERGVTADELIAQIGSRIQREAAAQANSATMGLESWIVHLKA